MLYLCIIFAWFSSSSALSVPSSQQDDITNDSTHLATEISQSDSTEDQTMNSQSQLIGTDAVLAQQVRLLLYQILFGYFSMLLYCLLLEWQVCNYQEDQSHNVDSIRHCLYVLRSSGISQKSAALIARYSQKKECISFVYSQNLSIAVTLQPLVRFRWSFHQNVPLLIRTLIK